MAAAHAVEGAQNPSPPGLATISRCFREGAQNSPLILRTFGDPCFLGQKSPHLVCASDAKLGSWALQGKGAWGKQGAWRVNVPTLAQVVA